MAKKKTTTLESVEVVQEVKTGFWQTTSGILVKRLVFQAIALVATALYDQLQNGSLNWEVIQAVVATQVLYVIMTFARDLADPKMPNTTNSVIVK